MTNRLYFEVKLLTDVILNQKAASEGTNATLDFIPGSNFLGIVAGVLYKDDIADQTALDLFHNGKVRFGDAHLASITGSRTLKVPAAMFYPKLSNPEKELYIQYITPSSSARDMQLKQCRSGFYDFTAEDRVAVPVAAKTNFAIKSAHDRVTRTSAEKQMYGYESLQAGTRLYFCVEVDEPSLVQKIDDALTKGSTKRIGRSRSAQYGLVKITRLDKPYLEVESQAMKKDLVTVYADARLVFIDDNTGLPTLTPTPEQLGVTGGHIAWEKSQIRTFQYAPWNFRRQCFDSDRCGIEKGSVIVIEGSRSCPNQSQYCGSYVNEGFGRVIYNPSFLEGEPSTGKASWTISEVKEGKGKKMEESMQSIVLAPEDSPLIANLKEQHNENVKEMIIFAAVRQWKDRHRDSFADDKFASQWGTIRSIATRRLLDGIGNPSPTSVEDELFGGTLLQGYLCHGVAAKGWNECHRRSELERFVSIFNTDEDKCLAIINLAAEMAKIYREKEVFQ